MTTYKYPHYINYNLRRNSFTPKEFCSHLVDIIIKQNTIICLSKYSSILFIVHKSIERFHLFNDNFKTVIISNSSKNLSNLEDNLRNSTDYNVVRPDNCCCCPPNFDVLLTDLDIFYHWLTNDLFYSHIDYLILDNCDIVLTNSQLGYIVNFIGSKFANSRILGITSEIVIGDKKSMEIEHYFLLLSEKLNCKLNTLSDLVWSIKNRDVSNSYIVEYENEKHDKPIWKTIGATINEYLDIFTHTDRVNDLKPCKKVVELVQTFSEIIHDLGLAFTENIVKLFVEIAKEYRNRTKTDEKYLLISSAVSLFETIRLLVNIHSSESNSLICNPKVTKLEEILTFFSNEKRDQANDDCFFGLIFVNNPFVAKLLCDYLQNPSIKKKFDNFLIDYHVSKKLEKRVPNCMNSKSEEVLKSLRSREINLLITNNPLKYRYDLPRFKFLINFDNVLNYSNFASLKQKAVFYDSSFIWLTCDIQSTLNSFNEFFDTDQVLLKFSFFDELEKDVHILSLEDKKVIDANQLNDNNNPIFLVNRYCFKLPGDSFTKLTPEVLFQKFRLNDEDKYTCSLRLPINSPVKSIIKTDQLESRLFIKWKTAYKACCLLKAKCELDDNFRPTGKENYRTYFERRGVQCQNTEIYSKERRFLLSKKRHVYKKMIAKCLQNAMPAVGACYLYAIEMKLIYPLPNQFDSRNRKLFIPEHYNESFGILTKNILYDICPSPIFLRSGETRVTIRRRYKVTISSEQQLNQLKSFHQFLFTSVLNFNRDLMVFNTDTNCNDFLIVPIFKEYIYNRYKIDWTLVDKICNYDERNEYVSNEQRKLLKLNKEDYLNAVVVPWYRAEKDQKYFYVAEICENRSPETPFQSDIYDSYYDYFKRKYNIVIQNRDQFLLDVDGTSIRLNFLTPRYLNKKGCVLPITSKGTKAKNDDENLKQYLVPELCKIHPFTASLWKKAVTLPSILYRLNSLLVAEELRVKICSEIVGDCGSQIERKWSPLDFGWNLKELLERREKKIADMFLQEIRKDFEHDQSIDEYYEGIDCNSDNVQTIAFEQTNQWNFNDIHFDKNIKDESKILPNSENIVFINQNDDLNFNAIKPDCSDEGLIFDFINDFDDNEYKSEPKMCPNYNEDSEIADRLTTKESLKCGPNPSAILEALTLSNANDGINLERAETIGDSELKLRVTDFLYVTFSDCHEGFLSHLRSKQVSNCNLFHLGLNINITDYMISSKFDPLENWLPPSYTFAPEIRELIKLVDDLKAKKKVFGEVLELKSGELKELLKDVPDSYAKSKLKSFVPYNVFNEQLIPEKSIADCVEALIGIYLTRCSSESARYLMTWMGLDVLQKNSNCQSPYLIDVYRSNLPVPDSPLANNHDTDCQGLLDTLLKGYDKFEEHIGYKFKDRSYLLQAFTHASYSINTLTDCYQKLEFLGDAVLDCLITQHLYQDKRNHSPGILTDLRSALVNNIIFALIAVRHNFHKYFRYLSHDLYKIITDFVTLQNANSEHIQDDYYYCIGEDGNEIEAPKALGDIFESVAGAIYLDSNRNLETVWAVYKQLMAPELLKFSKNVPKSPVRQLLELEPETTKFHVPRKLSDTKGVEVKVELFGKGTFYGTGRSYRIAKSVAAKQALRSLKMSIFSSEL